MKLNKSENINTCIGLNAERCEYIDILPDEASLIKCQDKESLKGRNQVKRIKWFALYLSDVVPHNLEISNHDIREAYQKHKIRLDSPFALF